MGIQPALIGGENIDGNADVREFAGGAVPALFNGASAQADFRDERSSVGLDHLEGEPLVRAGIDEIQQLPYFAAVCDYVIRRILGVEIALAEVVGGQGAEVWDFDQVGKRVRDSEAEVACRGGSIDVEFELGAVEGDLFNDDVEAERGRKTAGSEVRHPRVVVVLVRKGCVTIPSEDNFPSLDVMLEVVALLVAGPLIDVHGFGGKMDESLDAVGTVVAHANRKIAETDVIQGVVGNGDLGAGIAILPAVETESFRRDARREALDVLIDLPVSESARLNGKRLGRGWPVTANFIGHGGTEVSTLIARGSQRTGMGVSFPYGYTGEGRSVGSYLDERIKVFHELSECNSSN